MRLSSGLVIAGAYADKLRRTLYAQLKDKIKSKEIDSKEVARAAAELNRLLYEIIVNKIKLDKGDVVRVRIEYDERNGEIVWKYDTLEVEAFRRVDENEVKKAVEEIVSKASEIAEAEIEYSIEKAGETDLGDEVYYLSLNEEFAGAFIVTPLNGEAIVRGAVLRPIPKVIEKTKISAEESLEDTLKRNLQSLIRTGKNVESTEAKKVIKEIRGLIGDKEEIEEEEE